MCIWICVFIACMSTNYEKYNHSMALSQQQWYTMVYHGRSPSRERVRKTRPRRITTGPSEQWPQSPYVFSCFFFSSLREGRNHNKRFLCSTNPKRLEQVCPLANCRSRVACIKVLIPLTQTTRNRFSYLENSWNLTQHAWHILNGLLASIRQSDGQPPEQHFCLFHRAMWTEKK